MTTADGWRDRLLPHHADLIAASAIAPGAAAERGYRSVTTKAELRRLGFSEAQCWEPVLLVPIHGITGEFVTYQLRRPWSRNEARVLDEMRRELRRRERQPVAPDRPQLGPLTCDPFDLFCEEEAGR